MGPDYSKWETWSNHVFAEIKRNREDTNSNSSSIQELKELVIGRFNELDIALEKRDSEHKLEVERVLSEFRLEKERLRNEYEAKLKDMDIRYRVDSNNIKSRMSFWGVVGGSLPTLVVMGYLLLS